jgi:mannan endo-1,4-beta-mannosidase
MIMSKMALFLTGLLLFVVSACDSADKNKIGDSQPVVFAEKNIIGDSQSVFSDFVTSSGDKLMDGKTEFRFISYNVPCLHYHEDNMPFEETNSWRLPDEFEILDALDTISQSGGQVARIYTLSVKKADDSPEYPRHILGPGQFNEEAFRALDKVLQLANQTGVRIIIPFVDNWGWWGGVEEYAKFRGKRKKEFWTDRQLIKDFKQTIDYVINRTNYYTGVKYKEDKAILAWETGNELESLYPWTKEITAYIKSIDKNHLVIHGYHSNMVKKELVDDANIDLLTTHHYEKDASKMIEHIKASRKLAKGKKPYFIGEFGFIDTPGMEKVIDCIIDEQVSGALAWSLRYHNKDGGFYWHTEYASANHKYKAFHWPGFASGDDYDETNLVQMIQQKAFKIRGLKVPLLEKPKAPVLLAISDPAAISWQGSCGAKSYDVERSTNEKESWSVVGKDVSDAALQYRPLFADASVKIGQSYYYRIKAKNSAGLSVPSNIIGPVKVNSLALIDELQDFSKIHSASDNLTISAEEDRKTKEDIYRLAGQESDYIIYRLAGNISSFKLFVFFPEDILDLEFWVSSDGNNFSGIVPEKQSFYKGDSVYGYFKPVLYRSKTLLDNSKFLKIGFRTKAQISRVEIYYGKP